MTIAWIMLVRILARSYPFRFVASVNMTLMFAVLDTALALELFG
jgi:hypothetical protein